MAMIIDKVQAFDFIALECNTEMHIKSQCIFYVLTSRKITLILTYAVSIVNQVNSVFITFLINNVNASNYI